MLVCYSQYFVSTSQVTKVYQYRRGTNGNGVPHQTFQSGLLIVSDLDWSTIELEGLPEKWSHEVGIYPFR